MPYQLSVQCAPLTKALLEDRGPHEDRYVVVYANRLSVDGFKYADATEFRRERGWEFAFYPAEPKARYAGGVNCHRGGGSKDYVFSTFTPDQR